MKKRILFGLLLFVMSYSLQAAQVIAAGARSSDYGIGDNFPTKSEWNKVNKNMAGLFPGSQPVAIWNVGAILDGGDCALEFNYTGTYSSIVKKTYGINWEKHDQFLSLFDTAGIKVYLQVEPGLGNVGTLINLVMNKFKSHPCIAGFGIDVEWYKTSGASNFTRQITDSLALAWSNAVKAHNSNYRLFLKHWIPSLMPSTYRGDIVFIDDGLGFPNLDTLVNRFTRWANAFPTNTVYFQIGYDDPGPENGPNDYLWWKNIQNPPRGIGNALAASVNNPGQGIGIIWVDFTLRYDEVAFLFSELPTGPYDIVLNNKSVAENNPGANIDTVIVRNSNPAALHTVTVNNANFEIVNNKLKLKSGVSFDYELTQSVNITITVLEQGTSKTYSKSFTIAVTNVNETPTAISLSAGSVAENNAGATIGNITVSDPEGNNNHTVTVNDSRFEVVGYVLKLKNGVSLDYETQQQVQLEVTAIDNGSLSIKDTFTIVVVNQNEPPVIAPIQLQSIMEAGSFLPLALDLYGADPESTPAELIWSCYGAKYCTVTISADRKASFVQPQIQWFGDDTVYFVAQDPLGLKDTEKVALKVIKVNDSPVISVIPSQKITEKQLFSPIMLDNFVADADDPDSVLTWKAVGQNYLGITITNRIATVNKPDLLWHGADSSLFIAADPSGVSDSTLVVFECTTTNDTPTTVLISNTTVKEHDAGAIIGTITVTDPDSFDTHTILVNNPRFIVVSKVLRLADTTSLNYEKDSVISIVVTATDQGTLSVSKDFTIRITDVNEAPYQIVLGDSCVKEKSVGSPVGTVVVKDYDMQDTHIFQIDDTRFEIKNGLLKLKDGAAVMYSAEQQIFLSIIAIDKGALCVIQKFTIRVLPETPIVNTVVNSKEKISLVSVYPAIASLQNDQSIVMQFTLPSPGVCVWGIYDNVGNCLATKTEHWLSGKKIKRFDLKNLNGQAISTGSYVIKARLIVQGKVVAEQMKMFGVKK